MTDPDHRLPNRRVPFLELLDISLQEYDEESASFELTVAEQHLRTANMLHGGVSCTLLDTAMGLVATLGTGEDEIVVTSQLNLHFIRPARLGETLLAVGRVRHRGRKTIVCEGEIFVDSNATSEQELVAMATATFMKIPRE